MNYENCYSWLSCSLSVIDNNVRHFSVHTEQEVELLTGLYAYIYIYITYPYSLKTFVIDNTITFNL